MSDLAPFVAAAIRDHVVTDLQAENQNLRQTLQAATAVAITGPSGNPVYVSKDFSCGRPEQGRAFWSIRFDKDDDDDDDDGSQCQCDTDSSTDKNVFPLTRLGELEITVGGVLLVEMGQDYVEGFSSLDSLTGAVRFLELEVRKCWITFEILPRTISEEALELLRDVSSGMLWRVLSGHVATTQPRAQLRVQEISLDTKYVPGLLARIPTNLSTGQAQQELLQAQAMLRTIVAILRRHDPSVRGLSTLLARGRQVQEVLAGHGIHTEEDPRFDAAVERSLMDNDLFPPQRQGSNTNLYAVSR